MKNPKGQVVLVALGVLALVSLSGFGPSKSVSDQAEVATAVAATLTGVANQTSVAATVAAILGSGAASPTPPPVGPREGIRVGFTHGNSSGTGGARRGRVDSAPGDRRQHRGGGTARQDRLCACARTGATRMCTRAFGSSMPMGAV